MARLLTAGLTALTIALGPGACDETAQPGPTPLANPISLQPVVRVETHCPAGSEGLPGPGDGTDWCYFVEPGLTITRVQSVEMVPDYNDNVTLMVTLWHEDRHEFTALTRRIVGRDVAIVVRGRVVRAPAVLTELNDILSIPALEPADAADLLRVLID